MIHFIEYSHGGQRLHLFLKFLNLSQLLCHFCPILTSPSKIEQTVEQLKQSEKNLVSDKHGHPVPE